MVAVKLSALQGHPGRLITVAPGTGRSLTAVVFEFITPILISSAIIAAIVSAGVSPGIAIMSRPTEHTAVIASSLSRESFLYSIITEEVDYDTK